MRNMKTNNLNKRNNFTPAGGKPVQKPVTKPTARTNQRVKPNQNVASPKLPESARSNPLHVKQSGGGKGKIQNNLKKKSPWYAAIQNPAQGSGIKIPDDVSLQTGTVQCSLETSFTSNADGLGGIRTVSLHPNQHVSVIQGEPNGFNYEFLVDTSTDKTLSWGSTAQPEVYYPFPTNPVLSSYSRGVRVTSAALYVQPEVSLGTSQGELIVGFVPWYINGTPLLEQYRNMFGSSIMPLNVCKPMKTLWTPLSYDLQTYSSFYDPDATALGLGPGECPNWCLFAFVNGAFGDQTFRVRIVVNYEFVPESNAIDIVSANPSPSDNTEVDLVESWVASEPATKMSTNQEMSAAPGASILAKKPQDGGQTGFGMFVDVISEVLPYIEQGLEIGSLLL
jgi:hypothetical protein